MHQKVVSVLERIDNCGTKEFEITNGDKFLKLPIHCNNRGCNNSLCQKSRGTLHTKNHNQQIQFLNKYIKSPKAWVFTGWVLNGSIEAIRSRGQQELIRLNHLLHRYSKSPFVVYMEYKIKDDGSYYLHFHAIGGSFGDIHLIQSLWGRIVKYERPLVDDKQILDYIKKYTAKTPVFSNQQIYEDYVELVYKAQMCRYSALRKDAINEFGLPPKSGWYNVQRLVMEMQNASKRGRLEHEFIPLLDKPPNFDSDIPSCVYVYPTQNTQKAKRKIISKLHWIKPVQISKSQKTLIEWENNIA